MWLLFFSLLMFHECVILVYIIFSGATLRACVLQRVHNPVVRPAADLSRWPHGCDARTPAARSPHYAQYAVQASDQLWQRRVWLHGDAAAGPATVTPQGLRAQPQKTGQLWGRMRVSGFPSANKKNHIETIFWQLLFLNKCSILRIISQVC